MIRLFQDEDLPEVQDILKEGLKLQSQYAAKIDPPENRGFFNQEWDEHLKGLDKFPQEWWVYLRQNRVVGLLWLRFHSDRIGDYATVRQIIVYPTFRNRGIGTLLIKHAEEIAKTRNSDFFLISTLLSNPAYNLYQRLGFVDFPKAYRNDLNPNHAIFWKPYNAQLRLEID